MVGVCNVPPQTLLTKLFLEEQDFKINQYRLNQDNKLAVLLEINRKASSTKRTKYINIGFFYVKDNIDKKEMTAHHCPTNDMIAHFFTKPFQVKKFINNQEM